LGNEIEIEKGLPFISSSCFFFFFFFLGGGGGGGGGGGMVKEKHVPKMIELMMVMMWGMDSKTKTDTHK
jgi:hypothetical protein